jgi:hypothetical protein
LATLVPNVTLLSLRIMLVGTKRNARSITTIRYISQLHHDLRSTHRLYACSFLFFSNMLFLPFVLATLVPNITLLCLIISWITYSTTIKILVHKQILHVELKKKFHQLS